MFLQIILLDTDLVLLDSIVELWGHFDNFSQTHVCHLADVMLFMVHTIAENIIIMLDS